MNTDKHGQGWITNKRRKAVSHRGAPRTRRRGQEVAEPLRKAKKT